MSDILTLIMNGTVKYLLVASVITAVLTVLAWAIIRTAKVRAPIYCHMIWLYTLITIVTLPVIWLHGPKLTLQVLPAKIQSAITASSPVSDHSNIAELVENEATGIHSPRPISMETTAVTQANSWRLFPVKAVLAGVWFAGAIFMLIRLFAGWYRLRHIVLSAKPVSENAQFENTSGRGLKILLTSQVDSPVCFGLLQPVILLPEEMYNESSQDDLRMVLSHELAHIERRDCWTNLLQRVIEAMFFFHPFVWYASSQLTQQREYICDNYVLVKGTSSTNYVKLLSRIVEQGFEKNYLQAVALFEGRLLSRIRSMLDPNRNTQTKASLRATIIGLIALLIIIIPATVHLEAKSLSSSQIAPVALVSADSNSQLTADVNSTRPFRPQQENLGPSGKRPTGNCSISGKVISAENEKPVDNATVYLFYGGTFDSIFIKAASDGTFVFKDVPAGLFSLRMINTKGFQDAIYNPENKPDYNARFTLKDGEKRENIVLKAYPAYSIKGRIFTENGEPLRDSSGIDAIAWEESEPIQGNLGRYKIVAQNKVTADGSYLLDGLKGHSVYVMVIDWNSVNEDYYYPPCYYPGTLARNEARKVSFDKIKSIEGVDIYLKKTGQFVLEGIVTDEAGKPVSKALVTIHHRDMLFDRTTAYTNEQGYYRIETLGAGDFIVHIDAKPWGYMRTRKPVKIETAKVTKLDFTLRQAVIISGNIVNEDGSPAEISCGTYGLGYREGFSTPEGGWSGARNKYDIKGQGARIGNSFYDGEGDYEEEYMDFPDQATFIIKGMMPGKTILRFYPKAQGQVLKKILYNDQNIMDTGIETKPGQEVKDVTIVVGTP